MTTYESLYAAIVDNDLPRFQHLMLAHPEMLRDNMGKDAWLYVAARYGRVNIAQYLVALGIGVNDPHDDRPEGAIDEAASEGQREVVQWLLDHGARLNFAVSEQTRCMPLVGAIVRGHFDVVKLLVDRGADINANWQGVTPLSYALMYGRDDIAAYLRSVGAKEPWQLVPMNLPSGHVAILKHFEKHRGKRPGPLSLQEIVLGDPPIAVHVVPPTPQWDGQTLFTTGMSDRPLNLSGGHQGFAELAMYLPKEWPLTLNALTDPNWSWPLTWLLRIARYPHETGTWPGGPSLVFANEEPPQPLAPNTQLSCLLCVADPGDFGQIKLPDHRPVSVYSVYPIYTEERDLEKREGTRWLIELFEKHHVPRTIDVNRVNVAKTEAA